MLGGMAVPDSAYGWRPVRSGESPWAHILVSLAGPLAGFLLALLTAVTIFLLGGRVALQPDFFPYFTYAVPPTVSQPLQYVIGFSLYINIVWGVLNLLPVFPLDGGQIARELLQMVDPGNGLVRSLWLSVYVAAGVAIAGWALLDSIFMGLMFLSLAANNYMILQQIHGGGPGGGRW
jgi:Zn-dependent protease